MDLLSVNELSVGILTKAGKKAIVCGASFSVKRGMSLAIVGESGSGKTTLCRGLTRLFPSSEHYIATGSIDFKDIELLTCSDEILRSIRSREIRYVFQDPYQALNPTLSVGKQLMFAAGPMSKSSEELHHVLNSVGLQNPREVMRSYPHQLSIGMAQRVMIAMAILPHPLLLIADEPTSAVDASLRAQLLNLLTTLRAELGTALIIVTHDVAAARDHADQIAVMKEGRIVELASTMEFFPTPQHPYSQQLLEAAHNRWIN